MNKNLVWDWVEDFYVGAHNAHSPSNAEWEAMTAELKAKKMRGSLVYTEGGSPSAVQRKQLREALGENPINTAVLTDSAIARTAISALNLFLRNPVRAFAPNDLDGALQYTQAPPKLWPDMKRALSLLRQRLLHQSGK